MTAHLTIGVQWRGKASRFTTETQGQVIRLRPGTRLPKLPPTFFEILAQPLAA